MNENQEIKDKRFNFKMMEEKDDKFGDICLTGTQVNTRDLKG